MLEFKEFGVGQLPSVAGDGKQFAKDNQLGRSSWSVDWLRRASVWSLVCGWPFL